MNYRDISILAIRLAGIGLIAVAVIRIPNLAPYIVADTGVPWWGQFLATALHFLLPVLIGALFFMFPATLTNKFIQGSDALGAEPEVLSAVERMALSVLGVFFLFNVVSDVAYHVVYAIRVSQLAQSAMQPSVSVMQNPDWLANVVTTLIEFMVALWLIFGARGIQRLFAVVRGRG
ncbi:MAG: hypothetical protein AB1450_11425 [Pseudomonadota bacterium]